MLTRLVFLTAALAAAGCGDGRAVVSGTVTYKGQPLPDGQVSFHPDDKSAAVASQITNGAYQLSVPPGGMKVRIVATHQEGRTELGPSFVQYLPARYNEASELHLDLAPGTTVHDFDLQP